MVKMVEGIKALSDEHCKRVFSKVWPGKKISHIERTELKPELEEMATEHGGATQASQVCKFDISYTNSSGREGTKVIVGKTYPEDPRVCFNEATALEYVRDSFDRAIRNGGLRIPILGRGTEVERVVVLDVPPVPRVYSHDPENNTFFREFAYGVSIRDVLHRANCRIYDLKRAKRKGAAHKSVLRGNIRRLQEALVYVTSTLHKVTFPNLSKSGIERPGNWKHIDDFLKWSGKAAENRDPGFSMDSGLEHRMRALLSDSSLWNTVQNTRDYDYLLAGDAHTENYLLDLGGWASFEEDMEARPIEVDTFLRRIRLFDFGKSRIASAAIDIANLCNFPGYRNSNRMKGNIRRLYLRSDHNWYPAVVEGNPTLEHGKLSGSSGQWGYDSKEGARFTKICGFYELLDALRNHLYDPNPVYREAYRLLVGTHLAHLAKRDQKIAELKGIVDTELKLAS